MAVWPDGAESYIGTLAGKIQLEGIIDKNGKVERYTHALYPPDMVVCQKGRNLCRMRVWIGTSLLEHN